MIEERDSIGDIGKTERRLCQTNQHLFTLGALGHIPNSHSRWFRTFVGDDDRVQSGIPPNVPCSVHLLALRVANNREMQSHKQNWTIDPSPPEA